MSTLPPPLSVCVCVCLSPPLLRVALASASDEEDSTHDDIIDEDSESDRPLPQLPLLLREGSGTGERGDTSSTSPGGNRDGGNREGQSTPLFVPLLGTRHREGYVENSVASQGSPRGVGEGGDGRPVSPSQFAWRWMGLRPTGTPSEKLPQPGEVCGSIGTRAGATPRYSSDPGMPPRPTAFRTSVSSAGALGSIVVRSSSEKGDTDSVPLSSSLRYVEGSSSTTYNTAYPGRSPQGGRHMTAGSDYDSIEVRAIKGAPVTAETVAASGNGTWASSSAPDAGRSATWTGVSSRGLAASASRGIGNWRRDDAGSSLEGEGCAEGVSATAGTGFVASRRGGGGAVVPPSPASSSSFSLTSFEVIDKEDVWR